jgi:rare lipoprotein A
MKASICGLVLTAAFLVAGPALAGEKPAKTSIKTSIKTSAKASAKTFSGIASYYDKDYSGPTARGDTYDPKKFTAAHRTLPFGTRVRVTAPNKRSVVVEINDRGPFIKSRVIDLSYAAATELRMIGHGLVKVTARIEEPAK